MNQTRFEAGRFFLKDTIRLQVDFSSTDQSRGIAAPPLQTPCAPEFPRVDLPEGRAALKHLAAMPLGDAIVGRESVRRFSPAALSLEEVSMLLWATQGVRKVLGPECALRVVPSAGARHAFESYVAVSRVDTLVPGLYRYLPFDNQLAQIYEDTEIGNRAVEACHWQQFVGQAAVVFFWTAVPARMEWRYAEAAHKVIAIDAGHVCQNLYLAAQAIGAGTCAIAAYNQGACDSLLGVDGNEEFTVYIAPVGKC
ncbi:MAG TPA: SagB/ThcOx family dehydrogenase [Candidatus Hydrogenedentes bacterium]|nr:SagB/ThcOx family dehydrogenase [Candidatus Hydrogenedentota bacterium]